MAKKIYPLGATWSCTLPDGTIGRVWLLRRDLLPGGVSHEHWRYSVTYQGRREHEDWTPSRALALECCRVQLAPSLVCQKGGVKKWPDFKVRFKRVDK